MDLSHSSRHLPGRLAVLMQCDGDKTPVSAPIGRRGWWGKAPALGWEEDRAGGGWMDFLKR